MKNLFLTIVCACTVLPLIAGVPKGNVASSGRTSLHQLMRERNLTPSDNRLTKKAPRRLTSEGLTGTRIVLMEATAINDIDENGNPILSDTVYSLGWGNDVTSYGEGAYDDEYFAFYGIDNFYGKGCLPLELDKETGQLGLFSCYLVDGDTITGEYKRSGGYFLKTDTVRTSIFFRLSDFCGDGEYEWQPGTVFDDGSILFDGEYIVYTEEEYLTYRRRGTTGSVTLDNADTAAFVSPVLSNIYLLQPNGIHEYTTFMDSTSSPSSSGFHFVWPYTIYELKQEAFYCDISRVSIIPGGSGGSGGGGNTAITFGNGGLAPRPIDPRRPKAIMAPSSSQDSDDPTDNIMSVGSRQDWNLIKSDLSDVHFGPFIEPMGGGGRREGPIVPHSIGDYHGNAVMRGGNNTPLAASRLSLNAIQEQSPVYMFQVDDSTVFVYNLYGLGSTVNVMMLNEDGTMTFPGQALFYDEALDDDFCNYSLRGDTLILGNNGHFTPDSITWGKTVPRGIYNDYPEYYDNNRLFFTDGSEFGQTATVPNLRGDVNNSRKVSIADVTALINRLLSGDFDDSQDFSRANADVNRDGKYSIADVTALINFLLSNNWPD